MASKPTAFIDFDIVGGRLGVEAMLEIVDTALSPVGLAAFLYGAVGPWVKQRAADRFANEGDDVTGAWAPLKEATVEIREGMGLQGSHPINKRQGELEAYITQGEIGITSVPGAASLKYPKDLPATAGLKDKLSTAQKGRAHPNTVARPVLGLGERDLGQVMVMLAFHVQGVGVTRGASTG